MHQGMSMKLENFEDVLASIKKNQVRNFHLLIGNGFSIAYDPKIFSYNALHDFITKLDDEDLKRGHSTFPGASAVCLRCPHDGE